MLRAYVKSAAARAASWSGLDDVARTRMHRETPFVLCYHRVVERLDADGGYALPAMEVSVATLERQLDWLARHFRIVSLDELDARLSDAPRRKPLAAITFDDGYSDVYHHAFPLLQRKGIPAALFVVTDLVDTDMLPIHEQLHALLVGAADSDPFSTTRVFLETLPHSELLELIACLEEESGIDEAVRQALRPMTWDMLREMRAAGMTIGSHSRTHPFLTNENEERMASEIAGSRRELEERLGPGIDCFAYPDGRFNASVINAVANAGYRYAFTTCRHIDPANRNLTLPRIGMWERSCLDSHGRFSPAIMSCQTAGIFNALSRCRQAHA